MSGDGSSVWLVVLVTAEFDKQLRGCAIRCLGALGRTLPVSVTSFLQMVTFRWLYGSGDSRVGPCFPGSVGQACRWLPSGCRPRVNGLRAARRRLVFGSCLMKLPRKD